MWTTRGEKRGYEVLTDCIRCRYRRICVQSGSRCRVDPVCSVSSTVRPTLRLHLPWDDVGGAGGQNLIGERRVRYSRHVGPSEL